MEQKRPLVWLSADSRQDTTGLPVEKHWQATFVNAASPPVALHPGWVGKPVGVCNLAGLSPEQAEGVRHWLELLPATGSAMPRCLPWRGTAGLETCENFRTALARRCCWQGACVWSPKTWACWAHS